MLIALITLPNLMPVDAKQYLAQEGIFDICNAQLKQDADGTYKPLESYEYYVDEVIKKDGKFYLSESDNREISSCFVYEKPKLPSNMYYIGEHKQIVVDLEEFYTHVPQYVKVTIEKVFRIITK